MLKPAFLYEEEINELWVKTWYNMKYQYYFSSRTREMFEALKEVNEVEDFASVTTVLGNTFVNGLISYTKDYDTNKVHNFGIVSFGRNSIAKDVIKSIDNIFVKYKFNKLEFSCFSDNPVIKHYRTFCKMVGGREVGVLRETARLLDGYLHDEITFEVMRDDYMKNREFFLRKTKVI